MDAVVLAVLVFGGFTACATPGLCRLVPSHTGSSDLHLAEALVGRAVSDTAILVDLYSLIYLVLLTDQQTSTYAIRWSPPLTGYSVQKSPGIPGGGSLGLSATPSPVSELRQPPAHGQPPATTRQAVIRPWSVPPTGPDHVRLRARTACPRLTAKPAMY